jgi:hypothetical protein
MSLGDTGKTSRWSIHNNRSQAFLGEIKWYSAWRQYCFFTTMDAVFNDSCMRDIIDFISQLSAARIVERPRTGLQQPQEHHCDHVFVGNDMLCKKCGLYFPETSG